MKFYYPDKNIPVIAKQCSPAFALLIKLMVLAWIVMP